jgi:polysaccharide pyruvyl transferase CsaB
MHALLMGYYGTRNLGDEMMLLCLRRWLEQQDIEITVVCEYPDEFKRRHQLPVVQNWPLLGQWAWRSVWLRGGAVRLIRSVAGCDALIIGGGDLIREDCGWKQFMFTIEKILLAALLRKPVYLVNIGIGRPRSRFGRAILGWSLRYCRQIIVRDRRSLDICENLHAGGVTRLVPDIALSLPELLPEIVSSGQTDLRRAPYVLVCLRADPNLFRQYDLNEPKIQTLAAELDHVVEQYGLDIVFIPFQGLERAERDDNRFHQRVVAAMRHASRAEIRPWTDDLGEICGWFQGAQGVLAMRLHAAVLAICFQRPCILMPYDHKLREFGQLMGISDVIYAETLESPAQLRSVLASALNGSPSAGTPRAASPECVSRWTDIVLEPAGPTNPPVSNFSDCSR